MRVSVRKSAVPKTISAKTRLGLYVPVLMLGSALILSLPPFQLFKANYQLPISVYGDDPVGVCKNIMLWLACPMRLLRLLAGGVFVVGLGISWQKRQTKMMPIVLVVSTFAALALVACADYVLVHGKQYYLPCIDNPDKNIDYAACESAYKTFGLEQYGLPMAIVAAEIRQEQKAIGFKDEIEDACVTTFGDTPFGTDLSIGPAQIKKSIIIRLANEFPAVFCGARDGEKRDAEASASKTFALREALRKPVAAMLVGAYFKSVIQRMEKGKPACIDQKLAVNAEIARLWKSETTTDRVKALAKSFSPSWPNHPTDVLSQLEIIRKQHADKRSELADRPVAYD